jgi:hypothetical protein
MESLGKLLQSIGWPHITLIFAIIFIILFRTSLANLFVRISSIKREGINIDLSPQKQDKEKREAAVEELMSTGDTIVIKDLENFILIGAKRQSV